MHAEARSAAPLWLGQLTIELESPESNALIGGRDLATRPLTRSAAASQLDPKWLTSIPTRARHPRAGAEGGGRRGHSEAPVPGRWWSKTSWTACEACAKARACWLGWICFRRKRDPFSRFTACTDNWRAPNHRQSLPVRQMLGPEEEPLRAGLALHSGAAVPLFKARYPDGRQGCAGHHRSRRSDRFRHAARADRRDVGHRVKPVGSWRLAGRQAQHHQGAVGDSGEPARHRFCSTKPTAPSRARPAAPRDRFRRFAVATVGRRSTRRAEVGHSLTIPMSSTWPSA